MRRSEIVGLDVARDQTRTVAARSNFSRTRARWLLCGVIPAGARSKLVAARPTPPAPVVALQTWLKLACIAHGPLFGRVTGQGKAVGAERLNDQEVARLVKPAALAAGVRVSFPRASAAKSLLAIRCALASRPRPRSTSAMCRSSLATPAPR